MLYMVVEIYNENMQSKQNILLKTYEKQEASSFLNDLVRGQYKSKKLSAESFKVYVILDQNAEILNDVEKKISNVA
jgi:hypothetical protein